MSRYGFLTDAEYRELLECQDYLWRVRFALHIELKRYDNRLTFAHQLQVAQHLGFTGEGNKPIEMMMKEFYRTLRRVAELNKMLLKLFDQAIINKGEQLPAEILDADFQRRGPLIEARKPALFQAALKPFWICFYTLRMTPLLKAWHPRPCDNCEPLAVD